jgi:hypothetical protein
MRTLILNQDLKTLFVGAAFVVGLGLIGGAVMQPNLDADDGPQGPQILAGMSGPRAQDNENPYAVFAAYPQTLPDYVIGSDWVKPVQQDEAFYDEIASTGDQTPAYEVAEAPEAPAAPEAPMPSQASLPQDEAELAELSAATPG